MKNELTNKQINQSINRKINGKLFNQSINQPIKSLPNSLVHDNLVKLYGFVALRTGPSCLLRLIHIEEARHIKAVNVVAVTAAHRYRQTRSRRWTVQADLLRIRDNIVVPVASQRLVHYSYRKGNNNWITTIYTLHSPN